MLSPDELGLFRERIRFMDKKIQPGLTKLQWLSKGTSNVFIRDCLLHVDKVVTHRTPLTLLLLYLIDLFISNCLMRIKMLAVVVSMFKSG